MTCYKHGGCGVYENYSCNECPASKPEYQKRYSFKDTESKDVVNNCSLCNANWIDIEVSTIDPDDRYVFSTNSIIGLMYCPLCGRKLGD